MVISDDMNSDLEVDFIALVDRPAIQKNFQAFVEPKTGEHEKDFIPRCISYVVGEGKDSSQATAICYSIWEQHFAADKISFDWDETLSTPRGEELLKRRISEGATCYIISARGEVAQSMLDMADKYGIPHSRVYAQAVIRLKKKRFYPWASLSTMITTRMSLMTCPMVSVCSLLTLTTITQKQR